MANQNGQLILQALQNIDEPASVNKIVTHIADTAGVDPNDVKESVQETLNGGVRYGYIQRVNRKYYAVPVDLEALAIDEAEAGSADVDGDVDVDGDGDREESPPSSGELEDELEDRGGRRRRKRRHSRSRSRRGSRRRRRS